MIRTRDFLLFVTTLLFLGVGMTWTLAREQARSPEPSTPTWSTVTDQVIEGAYAPERGPDRLGRIEAVRQALGASLSLSQEPATDELSPKPASTEVSRAVQWCEETIDAISVHARWPKANVQVVFSEGARSVQAVAEPGSVSSSTRSVSLLWQLPAFLHRGQESTCLDSSVVGVTTDGRLLDNADVILFEHLTDRELVGYARDGFPIFGVSQTPEQLDECGGVEVAGQYRYELRTTEDFILACYGGKPVSLN